MNFKVGDQIVRIETDYAYNKVFRGSSYKVKSIGNYTTGEPFVQLEGFSTETYDAIKFVLAELYNSPLYKLMSEQEAPEEVK